MHTGADWRALLRDPGHGDHLVQLYQEDGFLVDAVARYLRGGLEAGDAVLVIATAEHRAMFSRHLSGAVRFLDAEETLAHVMSNGMPQWGPFYELAGGALAELRQLHGGVRAYGEMVDVLWQRGEREAAIRLEEYWNDLGKLQRFSLLCAYRMDPLDGTAYGGPLECVCKAHTHLIPARDYARFDSAVAEASRKVLDQPLAQMLLALSAAQQPATHMPLGQATLLWLKQNMPRTADKVLAEAKAVYA